MLYLCGSGGRVIVVADVGVPASPGPDIRADDGPATISRALRCLGSSVRGCDKGPSIQGLEAS